uniref:Predicted protein n=1 Tax=Physcomitrium patens TaxID=3218 RepID=A9U1B3_PHYPA
MNMEDLNEGIEIPQQEDESDLDNEGDEDELDKDSNYGKIQVLLRALANLTRRTNLIQLRGQPDLTTRLLANMRPELVGRLNVVPITGLRFRFRLFHPLCRSGNVLSIKGSLKGKNGGESSNETYRPRQKELRRVVEGLPYRFTVYSYSPLYSSSQKLIDCLNIGKSPYYLLQPDAQRILEQEST